MTDRELIDGVVGRLVAEAEELKREIRSGKNGITKVSKAWLTEARGKLKELNKKIRALT